MKAEQEIGNILVVSVIVTTIVLMIALTQVPFEVSSTLKVSWSSTTVSLVIVISTHWWAEVTITSQESIPV